VVDHSRQHDEILKPLSGMVEGEAKRVLSEAQLEPDPARLAAGWERRFMTDARRTEEVVALYEQLGYEVAADPIRPEELGDDREDCHLALPQFRTSYTRKR
jgi:hypothetical protein